jgi:hypothetical protein
MGYVDIAFKMILHQTERITTTLHFKQIEQYNTITPYTKLLTAHAVKILDLLQQTLFHQQADI